MRLGKWLLILSFSIPVYAFAGPKLPDSAWKRGTILDIQLVQQYRQSGYGNEGTGFSHGRSYTVPHLMIETPDMIYEVVPLGGKTAVGMEKGKLDYAVNQTVEYAMDNRDFYFRDANGKEGKFRVVKKTIKKR